MVSVYDRRLPACFWFLVRANVHELGYDIMMWQAKRIWSHGFSKCYLNEILYKHVLPGTGLRVPQSGSPSVKDAPTDVTCQLEVIV